jgi:hypothetical protein
VSGRGRGCVGSATRRHRHEPPQRAATLGLRRRVLPTAQARIHQPVELGPCLCHRGQRRIRCQSRAEREPRPRWACRSMSSAKPGGSSGWLGPPWTRCGFNERVRRVRECGCVQAAANQAKRMGGGASGWEGSAVGYRGVVRGGRWHAWSRAQRREVAREVQAAVSADLMAANRGRGRQARMRPEGGTKGVAVAHRAPGLEHPGMRATSGG